MKIGILTFHWATNYGAVLQCYALQEYLREQGHEVEVINYKPRKYDFWFKYIRRPWLIKNLYRDLIARRKELKLVEFRKDKLFLSIHYHSTKQMSEADCKYDIVISGSDQVLNASYTTRGEDCPTAAYYLDSFPKSIRVGYAVSFGCNEYPEDALQYAKQWINNFNIIGSRETTGLSVLNQMGYKGEMFVVPDPTILYGKKLFEDIIIEYPRKNKYVCVYILRKHVEINDQNIVYIDDYNNPLSMEQWLGSIIGSTGLITNSYHGMIVAILNHIPFVVLADASHMNDRFNTLLSKINLLDRICSEADDYKLVLNRSIEWQKVDECLSEFCNQGIKLFNIIK